MALTDKDRAALRAYWVGEELPANLRTLLRPGLRPEGWRRRRQQELLEYLAQLPADTASRTRRFILVYSSSAAARLVELMESQNEETARKAAVDLLRKFDEYAREETAAEAARASAAGESLAALLSDDQVQAVWAIMADAGAGLAVGLGGGAARRAIADPQDGDIDEGGPDAAGDDE